MLYVVEVGKPYMKGIESYQEGVRFNFSNVGGYLFIVYDTPTQDEIKNIRKGKIKTTILPIEEVLFLFFKFGSLPYMDAPYTVHLSRPFNFFELTEGIGYNLKIILVDGRTGIVKAIRIVGFPTELSLKLRELIENQKKMYFDLNDYYRKINQIYSLYSTDDLVRKSLVTSNVVTIPAIK